MTDAAFEQSLVDGSQVVSVLLVFLSILFGIKYQQVVSVLSLEIPDATLTSDRETFREKQWNCLISDVLPVGVPSLILATLLAPASLRIVTGSNMTFLNLDMVRTLFVGVELSILAAVLWSIAVSCRLLSRKSQAR
jgi:hypothetical protein